MRFTLSTRSDARRQAKRDALLAHALEIVVQHGLDALTMPELARQSDVAVGGIYRYFESKEVLIAALQADVVGELASAVAGRAAPGVEGVREAVRAVGAYASARPARFALLQLALFDPRPVLDDRGVEAVDRAVAPLIADVTGRIASATAAGELAPGDPGVRCTVLQGLVFGVLGLRKALSRRPDRTSDVDAVLEHAMEGLLRGWAPAR